MPTPTGIRSVSPWMTGDLVHRDAQLVLHEHRPRGVVPLAVGRAAGVDGRGAVVGHLELGGLPGGGVGRGDLDEHRHADAELPDVAASAPALLLLAELGVARRGQHLVQRLGVPAAVVHGPGLGLERELAGCDEVTPPHLRRVHADLGGEQVDRPLDGRRSFGPSGAAVGTDRGGVADHRPEPGLDLGDVVDAGCHQAGQSGQETAHAREGAAVLDDVDPVGQDAAVPVTADLDVLQLSAALGHADQVLAARLGPAQRPAGFPGRPGDDKRVAVDADLGAEAATYVGHHHADLVRGHAQRAAQDHPAQLRVLGAVPDGQLAVPVGSRGRAALHRQAGDPLVDDVLLDDHVAGVERGVVGGHRLRERDVGAGHGEQQGRVGYGRRGSYHRGQRLVVHADQVGGVLALVAAVGDHHRDRLADEAHRVRGQQRLGPRAAQWHRAFAAAYLAAVRRRRQVVHVADGQHGDHAGLLAGLLGVDTGDARMRDRAADEGDTRGAL